jgi:hypothetical protein
MATRRRSAKTPKRGRQHYFVSRLVGCPGKPRAPHLPPAKLKVPASVLQVFPVIGGGFHLVGLLNQVPEVMERGDRGPAIAID